MIAIILLTLLGGHYCHACDCDTKKGLKESDIAFRGKVVAIQAVDSIFLYYEITFAIDSVIEGKPGTKTIAVAIPCLRELCCGIEMHVGDRFEVFAYYKNIDIHIGKRLRTDYCWETHRL